MTIGKPGDAPEVDREKLLGQIEALRPELATLVQLGSVIEVLESETGVKSFAASRESLGYNRLNEVRATIPNWRERMATYDEPTLLKLQEQLALFIEATPRWIAVLTEYQPLLIAHQGLGVFKKVSNSVKIAFAYRDLLQKHGL